jgi:hypothetical protein
MSIEDLRDEKQSSWMERDAPIELMVNVSSLIGSYVQVRRVGVSSSPKGLKLGVKS